ncbi:flagellar FlbD family protein [Nocardioides KLBMP 9356]|uniref:Flagellar FlbD family protein n=1 Tax=Nocardioides potassii TaxID=2911371 RepID=A0ABS9HAL2_9ACTN|nr:flagellar FlbD family protein [Nocardioides potassii]MCF6378232.1 flagellar FlbD family protein [Nocardioides potassii]
MILLTRLSGTAFVLNADLIERLDSTPDTVVTLVDGKKYVVAEDLLEVVDEVRAWRSGIIAASGIGGVEAPSSSHRAHLTAVSTRRDVEGEA